MRRKVQAPRVELRAERAAELKDLPDKHQAQGVHRELRALKAEHKVLRVHRERVEHKELQAVHRERKADRELVVDREDSPINRGPWGDRLEEQPLPCG